MSVDGPDTLDHVHVRRVFAELVEVTVSCERLGREHTLEALLWSPGEGQWDTLEVIAHLRITGDLYNPRLRATVARTRERGLHSTAPYRPTLIGGWLVKQVTPELRRPLKAPRRFRPAAGTGGGSGDPGEIPRFLTQQQELLEIVREADGLDLNRLRLRSPVTPLLRFSIGDALQLVSNHQRRHLGQIQRILESPGFPG